MTLCYSDIGDRKRETAFSAFLAKAVVRPYINKNPPFGEASSLYPSEICHSELASHRPVSQK